MASLYVGTLGGIANARPLTPLSPSITEPGQIAQLNVRRTEGLGGTLCCSETRLVL